jgi:hypothetical protein
MRYGFDDAPIPTAKRTARASPREHAGAPRTISLILTRSG